MKLIHKILMISTTLLASACSLDPEPIPAEELYLRNFIKQFGLIDPNQDWNLAEASEIYLHLDQPASKVVVYADIYDTYYRVARCYNVPDGYVSIPLDVPVSTRGLAVQIDGRAYIADASGKVDTANDTPLYSRADGDPVASQPFLNERNDLGWLIVAEDLGSTDDVDFNDFIVRMSYEENSFRVYLNIKPDDWDVIDQNDEGIVHIDEDDPGFFSAPRRHLASRAETEGKTVVTLKAVAAGGYKKLWLHYRESESGTDYIIGPSGAAVATSTITNETESIPYEWHRWFGQSDGIVVNTIVNGLSNTTSEEGYAYVGGASYTEKPISGATNTYEVGPDFTFRTYSQLVYESDNPLQYLNFNFDKRQINGFYITVEVPDVDNENFAYDLGKVVGHTRNNGLPPQMFLIPDLCKKETATPGEYVVTNHFRWPLERVRIDNSYSYFNRWVTTGEVGDPAWFIGNNASYTVNDAFISAIYGD